MASNNLMTMEQPWSFSTAFSDAWIPDIFTKETDSLTKALQKSFSPTCSDGDAFSSGMVNSLLAKPEIMPLQTLTASGGSENEAVVLKPRRSVPSSGRITKRKSRASKSTTTTFIAADPANFRQMVQQVTGVRFGGFDRQAPVLKPEPQRVINWLQPENCLPTMDTSAFLVDGFASTLVAQPHTPSIPLANGGPSGTGIVFDSFCNFPTLESWKVM